MDKTTKRR